MFYGGKLNEWYVMHIKLYGDDDDYDSKFPFRFIRVKEHIAGKDAT